MSPMRPRSGSSSIPCLRVPRGGFVEGTVVIRSGRPARTSLTAAVKAPLRWQIVAGQETVAEGESRDDKIDWPDDLPVGAYRVLLTDQLEVRRKRCP